MESILVLEYTCPISQATKTSKLPKRSETCHTCLINTKCTQLIEHTESLRQYLNT